MRQKAFPKPGPAPYAIKLRCAAAIVISQLCLHARRNETCSVSKAYCSSYKEKNGEETPHALPYPGLFSLHIMSLDTDKGCTICHRGDDLFGGGQLAGDRPCLRERALCVGLDNDASAHLQSEREREQDVQP